MALTLARWQNRRQLAIIKIEGLIGAPRSILRIQLCVVHRLNHFHICVVESSYVASKLVDEVFGLDLNFDFLLDPGKPVVSVAGFLTLPILHFSKFKINAEARRRERSP